MRVAYVGNFRPSHSTENHVAGSLRLLGHQVVEFQEDEQNGQESSLCARVLASGAELLLYTKTWGLDPQATIQAWQGLDGAGVPTVSYHLDLYVGLDREEQLDREPFWRTRYVFSADGGSDAAFAAHGIDHEWLRAGVYGPECVPGQLDPRYRRTPVGFVGSHRAYHHEWPYRRELIQWLKRTYRSSFGVWPQGGRAVRGQALNDLYASVPVIVGDTLCPGFTHRNYWSDRVYETLGRGGFLIHPYIEGLGDEFQDGVHLRFYEYGDFRQLRELIDHYVAHPEEGRAIAAAGQAHVAAHCTYERRVEAMLERLVEKGAVTRHGGRLGGASLGRWSARFEPRSEVPTDSEVWREVWQSNDYRIDTALGLRGTVIDVGANVGAFTVLAAKAGADRVVAIEPEPRNRSELLKALRLNGVEDRVDVCAAAVTNGALSSVAMVGTGGGARVAQVLPAEVEPLGEFVGTLSLAELIDSYAPVSLLKMDIEGGEYAAFEALPVEVLAQVERIVLEFHGPAMPHLSQLRWQGDEFGCLVTKLADAGRVETFGHPSRGGLLFWTRY